MRRGGRRTGGRTAAMAALAVVAALAAAPRPAAARELREALEILEEELRAGEDDAQAHARHEAALLDAPSLEPPRKSLALGMALSGGVTLTALLTGGMLLESGADGPGATLLGFGALVAPSLGRLYYGQYVWAGAMTAGRMVALIMAAQVYGDAAMVGSFALVGLTLFDILALPFTRPRPAPAAAPVAVSPWVGRHGGGGLVLLGVLP